MKEETGEIQIHSVEERDSHHPEVRALMLRLMELEPKDLAMALYHLETFKEAPYLSRYRSNLESTKDQTQMFFSRGVKEEVEAIYLDLARHLKSRSKGSHDLMNAVFEFLGKTLNSMVDVPHLVSMN